MSDEEKLDALLDRWEELNARGEQVDPREICREAPELLPEFSRQVDILRRMNELLTTEQQQSAASLASSAGGRREDSAAERAVAISLIRAGRYVPVSFLTEGGLGRLFLARDTELNREVVLKLIKNEKLADSETRRRFEFEAEITSQLDHPGIVPVFGCGRDERADGRFYPYYAMRFIRGKQLEELIQEFHAQDWTDGEYNLELQKLLRRFLTVCQTIAYAHSRGIIHRDLKPANIMLGEYGETLVVDWGLAKVVGLPKTSNGSSGGAVQPHAAHDLDQTLAGLCKGTLAYMSPEQAEGKWDIVNASSDIYSLGVILYTLLTGRKAFPGNEQLKVLENVISGEFAPPRQSDKRVSRALECICLKAMQHQPGQRYATATALAQDIEQWLADEPVSAWSEPWHYRLKRWGKRHYTSLVSIAAAMAVAVVGLAIAASVLGEKNRQLLAANNRAESNFEQAQSAVRDIVNQASGNVHFQRPGMHRAQESLLKVALNYYRDFINQRANDPRLQEEMLSARLAVARIVHDVGPPQEALKEYQSADRMLEDLLRDRPQHPELRENLALVKSRLSQIDCELGMLDANRTDFEQSSATYQKLLDESPDDQRLRLAYASAVFLQGEETNDPQLLEQARRLIEIEGRMVNTNGRATLLLAQVCNQSAFLEFRAGRLTTAADSLLYARSLLTQISLSTNPLAVPGFEAVSSSIDLNRGRLARLQGDPAIAATLLESARKGFDALVRKDPEVGEYHLRLATTYLELGKLSLAAGGGAQASQQLSAAKAELSSQPYTTLRMLDRYELARSSLDLGESLLKAGEAEQARELFLECQRQFEALIAVDPGKPDYHRNLAAVWNQIAAMDQRAGDVEACFTALRNAQAELEPIATAHPDRPEFRNALAKVCLNLGVVHSSQDEWEDAWRWLRRAREIYDAEVLEHPDISEYQTDRTQFLKQFISLAQARRKSSANFADEPAQQRLLLQQTLEALESLKQKSELSAEWEDLMMQIRDELKSGPPAAR